MPKIRKSKASDFINSLDISKLKFVNVKYKHYTDVMFTGFLHSIYKENTSVVINLQKNKKSNYYPIKIGSHTIDSLIIESA